MNSRNTIGDDGNYDVNLNIPMGEFTNVTLKQYQRADQSYVYAIYLNGIKKASTINSKPREFENVRLMASGNLHKPAKAILRYFDFQSPLAQQCEIYFR